MVTGRDVYWSWLVVAVIARLLRCWNKKEKEEMCEQRE